MSLKEFDAHSGAPVVDDTTAAAVVGTTYGAIALDLIVTSPTNPRTSHNRAKLEGVLSGRGATAAKVRANLASFDEEARKELVQALGTEKLVEFVHSIYVQGVNQPILLRPLPASRLADTQPTRPGEPRPEFEIVAGERRYFGSLLAGKTTIPAMVKPMTDQEAREFQLVENLQRDDLHEMEEAEGYERLCRDTGIQKEDIGAKVGKSRSYVYGRLKLLDLCQEARQAFYDGLFDASRALLIARIPDQKLQLKALEELTRNPEYPPSVRNFQRWLHDNVMLRLDRAVFKITSADLLPDAGSCRDCPKRTGAAPELFADVESADICTDPKCFHKKEDAHQAQLRAEAEAKGMQVIAGKEAKELRPQQWNSEISGYLDLDKPLPGTDKPLRKVLGKDAPKPVLFIDPHTKDARHVVPAVEARKVLKDKGVDAKVPKQRSEEDKEAAARRRKEEIETRIEETSRMRAAAAIVNHARAGRISQFTGPVLRLLVQDLLDSICGDYSSEQRLQHAIKLWNLPTDVDEVDALTRHVQAADELELGPMLIALLLTSELTYAPWNPATKKMAALEQLASEAGVDLAAIASEVKKEVKDEEAAKVKAEKAKKAPPATLPAARAQGEPEGKDAGAAAPAKGRTKRGATTAPQLSAEAAKSGIADAMQNMDPASVKPFSKGDKVRFKQDLKSGGGKLRKVSGREGTIEAEIGDRAYSVRFGDKAHEVATADYTELEAIEEPDRAGLAEAAAAKVSHNRAWPFPLAGEEGAQ